MRCMHRATGEVFTPPLNQSILFNDSYTSGYVIGFGGLGNDSILAKKELFFSVLF